MIRIIFILFLFLFLPGFVENGRVVYDGSGIFSFKELTVELWIRFKFNPEEKTEKVWIPKGSILNFEIPEEKTYFTISCGIKTGQKGKEDSRCCLRIGFVIEGKEVQHPAFIDSTFFGNDWHHLAILWTEGKKLIIYVDGKKVAEHILHNKMDKDIVGKSNLIIGTPFVWYYENLIEIDEIRISSILRKENELSIYKNEIDPFVLFYENFENIKQEDEVLFTFPYIASVEGKRKYKIENGRIVKGKFGNCFSFTKLE
ncbi:MAG: LamG domain-containing protein [Candidatus Omnitrophica bacterium]|nr:LamG domain-containing protein [Candidatus Omnitrophota bacterium]